MVPCSRCGLSFNMLALTTSDGVPLGCVYKTDSERHKFNPNLASNARSARRPLPGVIRAIIW